MSTPGDEFVAQQLSDGFDVTGTVEAGVYGDPAGATAPPAQIDLSAAKPMNPDVDALEKRIKAQEAAQAAAAVPEPAAPDPGPALSGSVASDVREAFTSLHDRISTLEVELSLLKGVVLSHEHGS